jgi:hypothetical protein
VLQSYGGEQGTRLVVRIPASAKSFIRQQVVAQARDNLISHSLYASSSATTLLYSTNLGYIIPYTIIEF